MQAQLKRIYEFGPFQLDAAERLLVKSGEPVALPPKAFDTLLFLVENRGRLVEKEELMKSVWPDSFVEENNLNRSIYLLRKALGGSSGQDKYIETVPKHGYRFVANAVEVARNGIDLIVEKHTSSAIITEEEEIIDLDKSGFLSAFERQAPTMRAISKLKLVPTLRPRPLTILGCVTVASLAVLTYWWTAGKLGTTEETAKVKSLAVLPFKEIGARNDDHLGLGLADVLITRLCNFKRVNVRPTSAVLRCDTEQDSTVAGQRLGVDAVLEGTIQRENGRIRVTVRLIRISDRSPIWAGQFDERAQDLLVVQNLISERVADSLALNLTAGEKATTARRYTENLDASQLYIEGRYHWNTRTWAGMDQAQYFFRRAIEKDPNFALAYLGLADALFTGSAHPEAYWAVEKAIKLDPSLGEAYATRGFASMFHGWDWKGAEASFKRAIDLSPGYGTAHQWYATLLAITGRLGEAKLEMKRALDIDPMSPNFLADLGQMHYFAREYEQAEAYCRKALEVSPDFNFAHMYLVDVYSKTGRNDEAFGEYLEFARTHSPESKYSSEWTGQAALRAIYLHSGLNGIFRERLNEVLRTPGGAPGYGAAKVSAMLGDKEHALKWLENACENKEFLLPFVNVDPVFDNLHAEPRYQGVLRCMGLSI